MNKELLIPGFNHSPQPKGIQIKEGGWYDFYDGALRKVQVVKIRVHPDIEDTFQVIFRSPTLLQKNYFSKSYNNLEMELGKFTRYIIDYNSVDKVGINPKIIKSNE